MPALDGRCRDPEFSLPREASEVCTDVLLGAARVVSSLWLSDLADLLETLPVPAGPDRLGRLGGRAA